MAMSLTSPYTMMDTTPPIPRTPLPVMIINTARIELKFLRVLPFSIAGLLRRVDCLVLGIMLLAVGTPAATVLGPWVPIFRGIEHAVGTNTASGGGFPNLQVIHAMRVDLTDPTISLFTTSRATNWVADDTESVGYTTTNF